MKFFVLKELTLWDKGTMLISAILESSMTKDLNQKFEGDGDGA